VRDRLLRLLIRELGIGYRAATAHGAAAAELDRILVARTHAVESAACLSHAYSPALRWIERIAPTRKARFMSGKRLSAGGYEFGIDDHNAVEVADRVDEAMTGGTVARLALRDTKERPVTVYLNGQTGGVVVVDLDVDDRPGEISGR